MPEPTLLLTADGSHTLALPDHEGVTYHSRHGAIRESQHIFIEAGLHEAARIFPARELRLVSGLSILEIGFGTGLNAFLAAIEAEAMDRGIYYTAAEPHPIPKDLAATLNYPETLGRASLFRHLHIAPWDALILSTRHLSLYKARLDATQTLPRGPFHLVFFDAFAPDIQPELWTVEMFTRIAAEMRPGAVLVTYCSKVAVRRAMQAAGLAVEKLPGPPGKREIVRARKPA